MSEVPMTHRVFVYGTLKRGHGNNRLLATSRFIGTSATPRDYRMISSGFPVILEVGKGQGQSVAGELYHVNDATLFDLDTLESVGFMYDRKVIELPENGCTVKAFVYVGIPGRWQEDWYQPFTRTNAQGELDWGYQPRFSYFSSSLT